MAKKTYTYTRIGGHITFDSNGYIVEANGFSSLVWSLNDIDNYLSGKHVDDLAELIKNQGVSEMAYLKFEAEVHVPLLKDLLKDK